MDWMQVLDSGEQGKPNYGRAAEIWSPEYRRRPLTAAVHGGELGLDATSGYRIQIRARSKRNLTLTPRMCSVKPIMVGDELKVTNSGGSLREESGRLV
jgi:hypothetical protein